MKRIQWTGDNVNEIAATFPDLSYSSLRPGKFEICSGLEWHTAVVGDWIEWPEGGRPRIVKSRSPVETALRAFEGTDTSGMDYQTRSEFSRLKHSDVEQGKRIAFLLAELTARESDLAASQRENASLRESLDALARQAQDASDGLAARQLACFVREGLAYVKLHDRVAYAPDELPTVHAFMARLVENGARLHGDEAVYAAAEAHGTAVRR